VLPLGGIRTRLALALLAVVGIASLGAYLMVIPSLERRLVDAKLEQLRDGIRTFGPDIGQSRLTGSPVRLASFMNAASDFYGTRVVLFDISGPPVSLTTVADTDTRSAHLARDPVALKAARGGSARERVRRGGREYAQVAQTLFGNQVILFSSPLRDQLTTVTVIERRLLYATLVALGLALALGSAAAALHARRIRRLERAADRIASGEFGEAIVDQRRDELGELARSFDRMRVQLAALDNARKEFVANASHELRTPLFSLAGFLELLTDEDLDEETRRGFLQTTREQLDRLTALATDLLDLSRLDAGRMHIAREDVALDEVLHVVAEEVGPIAEAAGHTVGIERDGGAVAIADEERVVQVVRALARNAIVHTPAGTRVTLRATRSGASAAIEIEDDGPGIPSEHLSRVFQRFYRVEGARASGSGLGLAIAHELVGRMGGSLGVRSRPGKTVFVVTLPAEAAVPRARTAAGVR